MKPVIVFPEPDDNDALWRYSIISPLLHLTDDSLGLCYEIEKLSQKAFLKTCGSSVRLSPHTLRNWLYRYRSSGLDGLRNKERKDSGSTSVPLLMQDALTDLREQNPVYTVKRLLVILQQRGLWDGKKPARSTLYSFAGKNGLKRSKTQKPQPVRSFEFPYFGDLWSADFMHGPKVRQGQYARKTYLHAIIDDATRYIVAARFHLFENTRGMLDDIMLATRRFGIPKRFYTDNGAAFRSRHLRRVAAKLGMALPHTPPYTPRGRGKIERFFRTVRDQFLSGKEKCSLQKLNADFAQWLSLYHHHPHRGLNNVSPLNRKLADQGPPLKTLPATRDIDFIFMMEEKKRIGTDGCIRLFGQRFEITDALPGDTITAYYLPWQQDHIYVGSERTIVRPLDMNKNAIRFDKPRRGKPNSKEQQ